VSFQIDFNTHESLESKHHRHFVWGETAVGVCVVDVFDDAVSAPALRGLLAHPPIAQAPWLHGRLLAHARVHAR
jgi:predicted component of type VI protein secretion system